MPATLFFDGDKRRIYEVPEASSFVTDGNGYRIYTPDDIPSAAENVFFTTYDLWSRWVDFHNDSMWSTLAFDISGGAFRFTDENNSDVYALADLRLSNDWEIVPANYKHNFFVRGNLYPNLSTGRDFDTDRITVQGVSPRIQFSDRGERSIINAGNVNPWELPKPANPTPGTWGAYVGTRLLTLLNFLGHK